MGTVSLQAKVTIYTKTERHFEKSDMLTLDRISGLKLNAVKVFYASAER